MVRTLRPVRREAFLRLHPFRAEQAKAAFGVGLLPKTVSTLENHPEGTSLESLFKLRAALDLELVIRELGGSQGTAPPEEWQRWAGLHAFTHFPCG